MLRDNGVHQLIGTQDGIGRTGLDAQRAANAPVFIYQRQRARAFGAMCGVKWAQRLAGERSQAGHACLAARRALVYACFALGDGLRVMRAIRKAAARAVRLRQSGINACR